MASSKIQSSFSSASWEINVCKALGGNKQGGGARRQWCTGAL